MKLQKLGGYAAVLAIVELTIGWSLVGGDLNNPVKLYVSCIVFIVWSILLLITFLALHERMRNESPHLTRIMLIAGSVGAAFQIACSIIIIGGIGLPTQDLPPVFWTIATGFHNTATHAIGWTCLFIGLAILRTRAFSRVLGWLFSVLGIWWIPTHVMVHPPLLILKALDHLLCGVCFVWIGIALLRQKQPQPAAKAMAAVN